MSHLIDTLSYCEFLPTENTNGRPYLTFQNLNNYLKTYTSISESLKSFSCKGQKCEIILQINLFKQLPSVIQRIQIDKRKLTYSSKFILKIGSEVMYCKTKCLRLMIIKELESIKKKMKVYSYSLMVDQHSGEIIGKHIFSITPSTNVYQQLMCELIPLKMHLSRFLNIVLSIVNILPPLYPQFLHQKMKSVNQINIQQRIQRRIYKYYHFSIIELWKSYSKSPSSSLEEPEDKELQEKLQNQIPTGFNEQSSQMFIHRQKNKYITPYKFQITSQQNSTIQIHLKIPMIQAKRSQSNFVFSQIRVVLDSNEAADTGLRGASTKIMISKLKFSYLNVLPSNSENHAQKNVVSKQYTKLVAIKVPLEKKNIQMQMRKNQHQIKILKLFSQVQSPFLLRYFVCNTPNFKFKNLLMMSFLNNCETIGQFLNRKKEVLSFSSKLYVLINVLQALRLIKDYNVVHMDISPSNILVNPNYITHLIDFGQSFHQKICRKDYNPGYTLPFTFPQKFTSKHFTNKSDMFSFGIMTFFTMFKCLPYNPTQKLVESLKNFTYINNFFFAPESTEYFGYRKLMMFLFSYIQRCMDPDPMVRPHPGWSIILFKELYFWLDQVAMIG